MRVKHECEKKWNLMSERMWCHEIVSPLLNFLDLSSTAFEISVFLCSFVWRLTLVVVDALFKIEKFLCKVAISCSDLRSWTGKSFFPWQLNWSSAQLSLFTLTLEYFPWSSLPWFHCAFWSAFGLLRKFLHSVTPPHYACCIPLCSVQDTTPEGVLCSCGCSLTLALTTSTGVCHSAVATKSWFSVVSMSCSWQISLLVFDPTIILAVELLESFLSADQYWIQCPFLWFGKKPSVLVSGTISFWHPIEGRLTFRDRSSAVIRTQRVSLLHRRCTKFTDQRNRKLS